MRELQVHNQQRSRRLDLVFFRKSARRIIEEFQGWSDFSIHVNFLGTADVENLNRTFLQHSGDTDVITFDYRTEPGAAMEGEICISIDEAILQSARFRASWQDEVFRYFVHGLLHLDGFDDKTEVKRRVMKRNENRLMQKVRRAFSLSQLERQPK